MSLNALIENTPKPWLDIICNSVVAQSGQSNLTPPVLINTAQVYNGDAILTINDISGGNHIGFRANGADQAAIRAAVSSLLFDITGAPASFSIGPNAINSGELTLATNLKTPSIQAQGASFISQIDPFVKDNELIILTGSQVANPTPNSSITVLDISGTGNSGVLANSTIDKMIKTIISSGNSTDSFQLTVTNMSGDNNIKTIYPGRSWTGLFLSGSSSWQSLSTITLFSNTFSSRIYGTSGSDFTLTTNDCVFTIINGKVFVDLHLVWSSKGTASGVISIELPFASGGINNRNSGTLGFNAGITFASQLIITNTIGNDFIRLFDLLSGGNPAARNDTHFTISGEIQMSIQIGI